MSAGHMNWLHACYCLGAMLGPLVMTWALTTSGTYWMGYAVIGGVMLALAIVFTFTRTQWGNVAREEAHAGAGIWETLRHGVVVLQMALFFLYTGLEVTVGQWTFTLLTESRCVSPGTAGIWAGAYWGSIGVSSVWMRWTYMLRRSRFRRCPCCSNGPEAEVSEELCEGGGLVVGVEAAGVGEDPGVAAAEGGLLEADAGVFDAGDDAVGADADEGDDGGAPAFDFGFEALAAGAKFVVGEFIGAGGGAFDDVGDAEFEVEKEGSFKGGEEARGEAAAVEGGPEAVAGAAEVAADGGGVEAGVDAGEEDDEVFGDEIRDELVVRGEELGFGGFPGGGQCPIHAAASLEGIFVLGGDCLLWSIAGNWPALVPATKRPASSVHDRGR